jgi:hypothetical protein
MYESTTVRCSSIIKISAVTRSGPTLLDRYRKLEKVWGSRSPTVYPEHSVTIEIGYPGRPRENWDYVSENATLSNVKDLLRAIRQSSTRPTNFIIKPYRNPRINGDHSWCSKEEAPAAILPVRYHTKVEFVTRCSSDCTEGSASDCEKILPFSLLAGKLETELSVCSLDSLVPQSV